MFAIVNFKNIQIKKQDKLDLRKAFVSMRASEFGSDGSLILTQIFFHIMSRR